MFRVVWALSHLWLRCATDTAELTVAVMSETQ